MLHNDLLKQVSAEIALFQSATSAVDSAAADALGLNPTDLRCLGRLYARGPSTAGGLAAAAGVSRGAMTTALDRLETAGYVRRLRGDGDRRQVMVEITPRALELMAAIWGPIAEEGSTQLAELSPDNLNVLLEFLVRGRKLQETHAERIRRIGRAGRPESPVRAPGG